MPVPGFYFDGKTSRRHQVALTVEDGVVVIAGDVNRRCPISEMHLSERLRHASRKVTFPDGAYVEIQDRAAFDTLLSNTGQRDSMLVRAQQSWRGALIACLLTVAVLVFGYVFGLPAASNAAAKALPYQADRLIGREALQFLDRRILLPSELPQTRQEFIRKKFSALAPIREDLPAYEILFRKSKVGPNAFALPSGQIIITDELVDLAESDDAIMAILSHELGHIQERHLVRRVIQSSMIGAFATVLFGDVSSVVANVPTLLLDMKYSRDAEREADQYAIEMMRKNGISLDPMIQTFKRLHEKTGEPPPYLSSHPGSTERIEMLRSGG